MKNLFLPFVVVALFAIGSCDDTTINSPVDKQDTTIVKDTTIIKDTSLTFPFIIVDYDSLVTDVQYSSHQKSNGYPNGKIYDTIAPMKIPVLYPAKKQIVKQDSSGILLSYDSDSYQMKLSFAIDYIQKRVYKLKFEQSYFNSSGDNLGPKSTSSGYHSLNLISANYSIKEKTIIIELVGKELQDGLKINDISYTSTYHTGYNSNSFVSMLPIEGNKFLRLYLTIK